MLIQLGTDETLGEKPADVKMNMAIVLPGKNAKCDMSKRAVVPGRIND